MKTKFQISNFKFQIKSKLPKEISSNYELFTTLLFLWLLVPLTRYLWPKTAVLDGIRHYQEVVMPLVVFAAIGLFNIFNYVWRLVHKDSGNIIDSRNQRTWRRLYNLTFLFVLVLYLIIPIVKLHPYQITYFNELIGGPRRALNRYDLDYWGTSQKAAVEWVNRNAPPNDYVHIVMAADVASRYLRPDLLANVNKQQYFEADYVILLNRLGFLYRYGSVEFLLQKTPAYTVRVDDVPLSWVFAKNTGLQERVPEWWTGDDPCIYHTWSAPPPTGIRDAKQDRLLK